MTQSRPFLKWPGGKYRLVERISQALGPANRLIEPFVGPGEVFLNTDYDHYLLADNNPDLINLYNTLHKEGERFISYTQRLFKPDSNEADRYYELRDEFNQSKNIRRKAALFIYLNRHCYNGLCRYNKSGGFNSPFGRYKQPQLPVDSLRAFAKKSSHAEFQLASFADTMQQAEKGDVIYCDPPYMPLSRTANFTNYSADGSTWTNGSSFQQMDFYFENADMSDTSRRKAIVHVSLDNELPVVRVDVDLGSIPYNELIGFEVVMQFRVDGFDHSQTFWTDSNGLEMQEGVLNSRPTWDLQANYNDSLQNVTATPYPTTTSSRSNTPVPTHHHNTRAHMPAPSNQCSHLDSPSYPVLDET